VSIFFFARSVLILVEIVCGKAGIGKVREISRRIFLLQCATHIFPQHCQSQYNVCSIFRASSLLLKGVCVVTMALVLRSLITYNEFFCDPNVTHDISSIESVVYAFCYCICQWLILVPAKVLMVDILSLLGPRTWTLWQQW
jgi:hypothetical protein